MKRARILLGPVPCQGCRRFVAWVRGGWYNAIPPRQVGWYTHRWHDVHDCPAVVHKKRRAFVDKALAAQRGALT